MTTYIKKGYKQLLQEANSEIKTISVDEAKSLFENDEPVLTLWNDHPTLSQALLPTEAVNEWKKGIQSFIPF